MANFNLHIYSGGTQGGTDGTQLDVQSGVGSLTQKLNSSIAESKILKMSVRTDSGYYVDGDCTITLTGTSANKWQLLYGTSYVNVTDTANLPNSGWASSIAIPSVTDTNTVFWLKATSSTDEGATIDSNTTMTAIGMVGQVAS